MKVQIIEKIYFGFDVAFRSYMLFKEFFLVSTLGFYM